MWQQWSPYTSLVWVSFPLSLPYVTAVISLNFSCMSVTPPVTLLCGSSDLPTLHLYKCHSSCHSPMWQQWSPYTSLVWVSFLLSLSYVTAVISLPFTCMSVIPPVTPLCGSSDLPTLHLYECHSSCHSPMRQQWSPYPSLVWVSFLLSLPYVAAVISLHFTCMSVIPPVTSLCGSSDLPTLHLYECHSFCHSPMWQQWSPCTSLVWVSFLLSLHYVAVVISLHFTCISVIYPVTPLCDSSDLPTLHLYECHLSCHSPMWQQWSPYISLVWVSFLLSLPYVVAVISLPFTCMSVIPSVTPLCGGSDLPTLHLYECHSSCHSPMWQQWSPYTSLVWVSFLLSLPYVTAVISLHFTCMSVIPPVTPLCGGSDLPTLHLYECHSSCHPPMWQQWSPYISFVWVSFLLSLPYVVAVISLHFTCMSVIPPVTPLCDSRDLPTLHLYECHSSCHSPMWQQWSPYTSLVWVSFLLSLPYVTAVISLSFTCMSVTPPVTPLCDSNDLPTLHLYECHSSCHSPMWQQWSHYPSLVWVSFLLSLPYVAVVISLPFTCMRVIPPVTPLCGSSDLPTLLLYKCHSSCHSPMWQ